MMRTTHTNSRRVLRWVFRRGAHLLTCQLTKEITGHRYVLSLVPHWDRTAGDMEAFDSGVSALHRHAVVAMSLRESGWRVISYTGPSPFTPDYESAIEAQAS